MESRDQGWQNEGKKKRFKQDPEENRAFEDFKKKYAHTIVYLLATNVPLSGLREYFVSPVNAAKFAAIKKFRDGALQLRPKAKQWIDKPFYLNIKLGEIEHQTATSPSQVTLYAGDTLFKQRTSVVLSDQELANYVTTIGKILDGEKMWQDPDMTEFDIGDREYLSPAAAKAAKLLKIDDSLSSETLVLHSP